MNLLLVLLGVPLVPLLGLGLLLWLSHLEETLPRDLSAALRTPPPPPIRTVPVRRDSRAAPVPVGRTAAPPEGSEPTPRSRWPQAFSRSAALSLGGRTKR